MKLCNFVSAFEASLKALNAEAIDLDGRIARIEVKCDAQSEGRLATKLAHYRHRREGLIYKHRGAASWITTVAQPIFSVIGKRLGSAFQGTFRHESDSLASMRFLHSKLGPDCSLLLRMSMAQLCTEPSREHLCLDVQRSIVSPSAGRVDDKLPIEASISEVLEPLKLMHSVGRNFGAAD